jgi:hypothetical protein
MTQEQLDLHVEVMNLKKICESQQAMIVGLQLEVADLKHQLQLNDETRLERFYQSYLEKKFNASHRKSQFGISDIETDHLIIEIKHWKNYKNSLGQALSYSHNTTKKKMVYFFGKKPKNLVHVLDLFRQYQVEVHHIDTINGEVVEEQLVNFDEEARSSYTFAQWCRTHIKYDKGTQLKASDLCSLYFNSNQHPHNYEKNDFVKQFEKYVTNTYSNVDHACKVRRNQDITFRGWIDLCIK